MSLTNRGFLRDEKAASVIFGALLLILVAIVVTSGLALSLSISQKNMIDRQSAIEASENENLKIVTIQPAPGYNDSPYWNSVNVTVLNLDILDSRISAVSINGNYLMNFFLKDDYIEGSDYLIPYNSTYRAEISAGEYSQICLGKVYTSEYITPVSVPSTLSLTKYPTSAYSAAVFPNTNISVRVHETATNTYCYNGTDYTVDGATSSINILGGNMSTGTNYTIEYQTLLDPAMQVSKKDPITIEILSDRTNLFSRRFMPPEPIAEAELKNFGGSDYLLLDGSTSIDPDPDGFITSYRWEIYDINSNATPLYGFNITNTPLKGVKVNPSVNIANAPFKVDLEVVDNTGMVSRLSDITGKITVYPTP